MGRRLTGLKTTINRVLHRNRVGEILVSRGKITSFQLKDALTYQKQHGGALGSILLLQGVIVPADLRMTLMTQSVLRVATVVFTLLTCSISLSSFQAMAGALRDIPNQIILASAGSVSPGIIKDTVLFGTGEKSSADLTSFTKWTGMFDRFEAEVNDRSSDGVVRKWRQDLSGLRGLPLEDMASGVNNLMNRVAYIADNRNWGKSDYWETPVEFLTRGGDCEDFAIAKYASLRALGVADNLMRVAIVKDLQKGIPHAILIVYTQDGPMVLDNQIKRMTSAADIHHYKPIFSINRAAWWLHTDQNTNSPTQIASAAR